MLKKRFTLSAILSVLLCVSTVFTVEAASTMWIQTYGGTDDDFGNSVVETSDGGYVIAGYTWFYDAGEADLCLVKTDEYGVVPETAWVVFPLLATAP